MLALVAGEGQLPALVAKAQAGNLVLCVPKGSDPQVNNVFQRIDFRLETLGTLLSELKQCGVVEVCFAGAVHRPTLDPTAIDAATRPLMEQVVGALSHGDDGALRVILRLFEHAGFTIRAAHELVPGLLPPSGVPSRTKPGDHDGTDAARGADIVTAMGQVDLGQACVVADGQALAVEAQPGTDWMLTSLATLNLKGRGLLYKAPKPGQDRRVDLPTIGPATLRNAARAGLRGVVIEAGGVLLLEPQETLRIADEAGLFLWVRDRGPV